MVLFYSNKPTKREESDLNEPLLKSILEDSLDAWPIRLSNHKLI